MTNSIMIHVEDFEIKDMANPLWQINSINAVAHFDYSPEHIYPQYQHNGDLNDPDESEEIDIIKITITTTMNFVDADENIVLTLPIGTDILPLYDKWAKQSLSALEQKISDEMQTKIED